MNPLRIVAPSEIPLGQNCPDDLKAVYEVCLQMQEICYREDGAGLAAVQVGIPWNLFVVKLVRGYGYYLDCVYENIDSQKEVAVEGCLSLRNDDGNLRYFEVERYLNIRVRGKKLSSNSSLSNVEFEVTGFYSKVFQHEIDHQFQVTIDKIGKEVC